MSKRHILPASRRHLEIYDEDWDFLVENFGRHTAGALGPGPAIRNIVHAKVKALRAKQISRLDELAPGEDQRNTELMRRNSI